MDYSKNIALFGVPQSGKSTILQRFAELLGEEDIPFTGFIGKEIRTAVVRQGFQCVPVGEASGLVQPFVLAHMNYSNSPHVVGKYGVDVKKFDSVCDKLLSFKGSQETKQDQQQDQNKSDKKVVIIDEIGALESFSKTFTDKVQECLDDPKIIVISSVSQSLYAQTLQSDSDTYLLPIDEHTAIREDIPGLLLDFVKAQIDEETDLPDLNLSSDRVNRSLVLNQELVGDQPIGGPGQQQGGFGGQGGGFGRGRRGGRGRGRGGRGRGRGRGGFQTASGFRTAGGGFRQGPILNIQPGKNIAEVSQNIQKDVESHLPSDTQSSTSGQSMQSQDLGQKQQGVQSQGQGLQKQGVQSQGVQKQQDQGLQTQQDTNRGVTSKVA